MPGSCQLLSYFSAKLVIPNAGAIPIDVYQRLLVWHIRPEIENILVGPRPDRLSRLALGYQSGNTSCRLGITLPIGSLLPKIDFV